MKLGGRCSKNFFKLYFLKMFNRLEDSEWKAFLDIAEHILNNDDIAQLNEKDVVIVKVSHADHADVILVTFNHIDYDEDVVIEVGNYGRDDFWYMDLMNVLDYTITKKIPRRYIFNYL